MPQTRGCCPLCAALHFFEPSVWCKCAVLLSFFMAMWEFCVEIFIFVSVLSRRSDGFETSVAVGNTIVKNCCMGLGVGVDVVLLILKPFSICVLYMCKISP